MNVSVKHLEPSLPLNIISRFTKWWSWSLPGIVFITTGPSVFHCDLLGFREFPASPVKFREKRPWNVLQSKPLLKRKRSNQVHNMLAVYNHHCGWRRFGVGSSWTVDVYQSHSIFFFFFLFNSWYGRSIISWHGGGSTIKSASGV